jgi:hypothetical protein
MDEKEKRIAIKKRKRDQARREQEDAQRNLEKQKEDQKNRKKGRRTEDDPEGEKLTKDVRNTTNYYSPYEALFLSLFSHHIERTFGGSNHIRESVAEALASADWNPFGCL